MVEYLIGKEASIDIKDNDGVSVCDEGRFVLLIEITLGNYIRTLTKKAYTINHSLHQRIPLHVAVEGGHLDTVKYFLEKGVDIDIKQSFGVSVYEYTTESQGRTPEYPSGINTQIRTS